uniref:Senescence domain-containing protein n=1 Tax=Meloidogyne hapla TaxID=6305 RepID=A0A1I8BSV4_MELHA
MTHVDLDLDKIDWEPFLSSQVGGGRSDMLDGNRYFQGTRYQRGFGVLGAVGRFLMPIVKNIATSAGQEAVNAGKNILEDVSQGRSVSDALKQHGSEGLQKVGKKLQQCGKGKRMRKNIQNLITKNNRRRYRDQLSLEDI